MAILRPIPRGIRFDPAQVRTGTRVEMEHTTSRSVAEQIAKHHLIEDRNYYRKLRQVHLDGKVGLAPGTTTMTTRPHTPIPTPGFASPWNPAYPDPHQRHMPKDATIVGGAMTPHDFELAKVYGYTPYMQGWATGKIGPRPMQTVYTTGYALGEMTPEQQQQLLLEERLKTERVMRTWTIVGGVVGVGGLLIALLSLGRR